MANNSAGLFYPTMQVFRPQVFRPLLLLAASTFLFGCQAVAASPLLLSTSAQIVELESLKALRGLYVARKPVNLFMKSATETLQLKYSVEKRVIIYESTDAQGNTIKNSAAVLVPLIPPGSSAAGMSGESGDYADCAGCPTILYHFDGGIGMVDNVEQEVPTAQAITLETNLPFPYMMYLAMWYVITSVGVCTLRKKKG